MIIMPVYNRGPVPPRVTVDGVTLKKGDTVWRHIYGACITRSKVTNYTLRYWSQLDRYYSTEMAAIEVALVHNAEKLKKAKQAVKSHTNAIARLQARRAAVASR